jgi:hypothetical protein
MLSICSRVRSSVAKQLTGPAHNNLYSNVITFVQACSCLCSQCWTLMDTRLQQHATLLLEVRMACIHLVCTPQLLYVIERAHSGTSQAAVPGATCGCHTRPRLQPCRCWTSWHGCGQLI